MKRLIPLVIVGLALTACGGEDDSHSDINDDDVAIDMTPWTVYANYDGYPNVAVRCSGADRMFTTTRSDTPLIVVPNAADCREEGGG